MPSEKDGVMIILSSPSGAGKTTLVKMLSELDNFKISISHTTRQPRQNETPDKDYFFVDEIGKASIKYWQGATLQLIIPPIPAIGAIVNVSSTAAYVTNPGQWIPTGPDNQTTNTMDFLNKLVGGFQKHLPSIQGNYDTISNYPGFPVVPPAPGVRPWKGWLVTG